MDGKRPHCRWYVLALALHGLVTSLLHAYTPFCRALYKEEQAGVQGVEMHTTHLSYQISIFRMDQDHRSQPLKEGEGFIELRRGKQGPEETKYHARAFAKTALLFTPSGTPGPCRSSTPLQQYQREVLFNKEGLGEALPFTLTPSRSESRRPGWGRSDQSHTMAAWDPPSRCHPDLLLSRWMCSTAVLVDGDNWCSEVDFSSTETV